MKRIFLGLLFLPALLTAQQSKGPGFVISGTVAGLPDHSSVFLSSANVATDTLGRSLVLDGRFTLQGEISEPNLFELTFASEKKKILVFIGNDQITISGSVEDIKNLQVKGSPTNDDFTAFQTEFNPLFMQLKAVTDLANSSAGASKRDSLIAVYGTQVGYIQSKLDQFLSTHASSYVSPFILVAVLPMSDDVMLLEKRLNGLSETVQNSTYGKYLKEQIDQAKVGAVGTQAVDFTQNDTTGNPVTLSSFKGKYVLLDFWASWCRPCRMENPNVVATFKKFKNKNFTILSVSLDRAREPWIKAIHDDGLVWANVSDLKFWDNEVAVKYRIQQIPQNVLIDPSGRIVAKNLRGPDLEAKLCEFLGCN